MIFSGEDIRLSSRDEEVIGFPGQAAFTWGEFGVLHHAVAEAFALEYECEFTYFEVLRDTCNDMRAAFDSSALAKFGTHRLGQMLVSLDRIAEAE